MAVGGAGCTTDYPGGLPFVEMSEFSVAASFERKAKEVTGSQQSIQTLSVWAIHHRKHAKSIVEAWLKELLSCQ